MFLGGMKAPLVPFHSRDIGVRSTSTVRMYLSCLVDLNSDLYRLCGSIHGLDTFWARGWFDESRYKYFFGGKKRIGKKAFPEESPGVWDKLKDSENDAVVNVYSEYFLDPFDDESPQDKTNRDEEEKEEAGEVIWSSCSRGGGLYEEFAVGDIHVFPVEISTFEKIRTS